MKRSALGPYYDGLARSIRRMVYWGVSKSTFASLTAQKQSVRRALGLKGLDLLSELVMGVFWVCYGCIIQ